MLTTEILRFAQDDMRLFWGGDGTTEVVSSRLDRRHDGVIKVEPSRLEHLAEDVLEDAAVFVVVDFFGGVDAGDDGEFLLAAVGGFRGDLDVFARGERRDAVDAKDFVSGKAVRLTGFAWLEFERENAHADQVAAVDALVAFSDDGADAEQTRTFRGPVAR